MGEVLGLHASVNAAKKFIESKRGEDFYHSLFDDQWR